MTREAPGWDRLGRRKPQLRLRGRGRWLRDALRLLVLLRTGRWSVAELAAELGLHRRSVHRMLQQFARVGIELERHPEGKEVFWRVDGEALRRLLGL